MGGNKHRDLKLIAMWNPPNGTIVAEGFIRYSRRCILSISQVDLSHFGRITLRMHTHPPAQGGRNIDLMERRGDSKTPSRINHGYIYCSHAKGRSHFMKKSHRRQEVCTRRLYGFLPDQHTWSLASRRSACYMLDRFRCHESPDASGDKSGRNVYNQCSISPNLTLLVLPTGGPLDFYWMICVAFELETQARMERWAGNLVFVWMERMWVVLEGSSDIYQEMRRTLCAMEFDWVRAGILQKMRSQGVHIQGKGVG